jgi:membrane protein
MNVTWAVPRHRRPNPIRARLRSLLVIVIGGGAALATTVLSALASSAGDYGAEIAGSTAVLVVLGAVAVNAGIFLLAFRVSTAHPTSMRDLMPGAITAALIWQMVQFFGTAYVGNIVKGAGAAYGVFALVLGLLAWIYLGAVGVVISAEINVVRAKRLYPRALMTPFTDDVDLTAADRHAYTDAATAQKAKGFENVDVTFDHDGQEASARRGRRRGKPAAVSNDDDVGEPHGDVGEPAV